MPTSIVNLRNLIVLLLGINNIFIESMACNSQQETLIVGAEGQRLEKVPRAVGYFIGQNYFLKDEMDARRLLQTFREFPQTRHEIERETKRRAQMEQEFKKRQVKLHERQRVGTKYEDFLIHRGHEARAKLRARKQANDTHLSEDCTFTPRINDAQASARGKANSNIFETLYRRAEELREKSHDWREHQQAEEAKKLSEVCTFKPDLTKGKAYMRRQIVNEESRVVSHLASIKAIGSGNSDLHVTSPSANQNHHSIF